MIYKIYKLTLIWLSQASAHMDKLNVALRQVNATPHTSSAAMVFLTVHLGKMKLIVVRLFCLPTSLK